MKLPLRSAFLACASASNLVKAGFIILILGLLGEAFNLLTPIGSAEKSIALLCIFLIIVGIWVEEVGGEEERDNETREYKLKIAALEFATEQELHARVKLEAQLAMRELSKEQYEQIQSLKGSGLSVILTSMPDFDSLRFCRQLEKAFLHAGLRAGVTDPRVGQVWEELYVVIPEPIEFLGDDLLYVVLKQAGLSVGCGLRVDNPMPDCPPDVRILMVGGKALPRGSAPPYVFTLPPKTDAQSRIINPT